MLSTGFAGAWASLRFNPKASNAGQTRGVSLSTLELRKQSSQIVATTFLVTPTCGQVGFKMLIAFSVIMASPNWAGALNYHALGKTDPALAICPITMKAKAAIVSNCVKQLVEPHP